MSFRSMVRDIRESFGNISRRNFEVRIHHRGKSLGSSSDLQDRPAEIQQSRWASLPPELLRDVMKRLEEDDSSWPDRKDVVCCASVCTTWRDMCKDIVRSPEHCAKLTFPVSLKQAGLVQLVSASSPSHQVLGSKPSLCRISAGPGPRDGVIQCFIKRDKSKLTYRLYLSLSSAVLDENGKFLLAAKRSRRMAHMEYAIFMDSRNFSRSSTGHIGKLRSNFLGTKFIIYDTQPPYNAGKLCAQERAPSRRLSSRKVSPRVPMGSYPIAQVNYELNVLGTRGPRRMQCAMHSIPASAVEPGGVVPIQSKELPRLFDESFRSTATSFSKYSVVDSSMDLSSCRFSELGGGALQEGGGDDSEKERPLVLRNKAPRWHEQLQCWCLNFRGRVTVASVKNFQLIASAPQPAPVGAASAPLQAATPPTQTQPQASGPSSSSSSHAHDPVILQFGKVGRDMFTMDYRYPLSAFQAFAICLTSFDTKLACE